MASFSVVVSYLIVLLSFQLQYLTVQSAKFTKRCKEGQVRLAKVDSEGMEVCLYAELQELIPYGDINCGSEIFSMKSFRKGGHTYLAIADRDRDAVFVYKWEKRKFELLQEIRVEAVWSVEVFSISDVTYLGVASYRTGNVAFLYELKNTDLLTYPIIYKWNEENETFCEFQTLDVVEARGLRFTQLDTEQFVLFALNGTYANTPVYEWNGQRFVRSPEKLKQKSKYAVFVQHDDHNVVLLGSDRSTTIWQWSGVKFFKKNILKIRTGDSTSMDSISFHGNTYACFIDTKKTSKRQIMIKKCRGNYKKHFDDLQMLQGKYSTTCKFFEHAERLYLFLGGYLEAAIFSLDITHGRFTRVTSINDATHVTAVEVVDVGHHGPYIVMKMKSKADQRAGDEAHDVCRYYKSEINYHT
ncbi:leucine-rich repeat LGI family member 2-like [Ptychodera flava]|uniref:leucine-rich repeat LGI family member 2-like n=1 Tax=Ptychodera flava TaxID=63121 RepID=UPI00396A489E